MKGQDLTIEKFKEKVTQLYGNKYDISKVDLDKRDSKGRVLIMYHEVVDGIMKTWEFWMSPSNFLRGKTTYPHKKKKTADLDMLVEKCKTLYGDTYDLSHIKKYGYDSKYNIEVKCQKHGWFYVNLYKFQKGCGCPKCAKEKKGNLRYTQEDFITKCKNVHSDKYDLSQVVYRGIKETITPICRKHGLFTILADNFSRGEGCVKCTYEKLSEHKTKTQVQYIEECKKTHGDKYIIDETIRYSGMKNKVYPICVKHGRFETNAEHFLYGSGCPKCGHLISKPEIELYEYISSLVGKDNVVHNSRTILPNKKELDIYVPSKSFAIEFNGLIWHSDKYHDKSHLLEKTKSCDELGIRLIHIYEDEWLERKDLLKNKIKHFLGLDDRLPCIGARKCQISEINTELAKTFLNKFHLQGFASATIHLGAFYENELLGVMSFLKEADNKWNLVRYATNTAYRIPGLANKMFKYFIQAKQPQEVKTFLDRRYGTVNNNVYNKMGFILASILSPDYYYTKGVKKYHKFNFRKERLHKKYDLPLTMTESEMTQQLGYYRIWNCGLFKYIWKKT